MERLRDERGPELARAAALMSSVDPIVSSETLDIRMRAIRAQPHYRWTLKMLAPILSGSLALAAALHHRQPIAIYSPAATSEFSVAPR